MMRVQAIALVSMWVSLCPNVAGAESHFVVLNDDGGWCWFEEERAIVAGGHLLVGAIAAGRHDPARRGNVEVVAYRLASGDLRRIVLHERFQCDDHASPALAVRGDGRILAMYSRHGNENRIYYRITEQPGDPTRWGDEQIFVPSETSRVTYSNLYRLSRENDGRGRFYNFFRGYDDTFKPSWMTSDDDGQTWTARGLWIDFPAERRHRPYGKYISDGRGTIHFAFTEGHPRDFDNSIYHAYYRGGAFYRADGVRIRAAADGPITPAEATRVFAGDPHNVAWISDLHLDSQGRPAMAFSVQKDSAGLPSGDPQAGRDHRYFYGRWSGAAWQVFEIAYGGSRLYAGEDDYTGNLCLDPNQTDIVYLSANVDPRTGKPNASGHYELHRTRIDESGIPGDWTCLTPNATEDHLRPIVPLAEDGKTMVLWLRGAYRTYTDYDLEVVALTPPAPGRAVERQ